MDKKFFMIIGALIFILGCSVAQALPDNFNSVTILGKRAIRFEDLNITFNNKTLIGINSICLGDPLICITNFTGLGGNVTNYYNITNVTLNITNNITNNITTNIRDYIWENTSSYVFINETYPQNININGTLDMRYNNSIVFQGDNNNLVGIGYIQLQRNNSILPTIYGQNIYSGGMGIEGIGELYGVLGLSTVSIGVRGQGATMGINAFSLNGYGIYAESRANYSGYFTGGLGVKINSGNLTLNNGGQVKDVINATDDQDCVTLSQVQSLISAASGGPINGEIRVFDLVSCPVNWYECNGSSYMLPGGGIITPPDLRQRFIIGSDPASSAFGFGGIGGSFSYTPIGTISINPIIQVINHTHIVTDPGHTHTETYFSSTSGSLTGWTTVDTSSSTQANSGLRTVSNTTGIIVRNQTNGVNSITPTGSFTGTVNNTLYPKYWAGKLCEYWL